MSEQNLKKPARNNAQQHSVGAAPRGNKTTMTSSQLERIAPLAVIRTGSDVSINFVTEDGLIYQLESAPALTGPWRDLGAPFVGTGRPRQINVSAHEDAQYFQIKASREN